MGSQFNCIPSRVVWCWVIDVATQVALALVSMTFILAFFVLPSISESAAILVACLFAVALVSVAIPARVIIGDDGVHWRQYTRPLPGKYLPYDRLKVVLHSPNGLTLQLVGGKEVTWYPVRRSPDQLADVRAALQRRLGEWKQWYSDNPAPTTIVNGSSLDPYRSAQTHQSLLLVAAMPHAGSTLRIAAASNLVRMTDDEDTRATLLALAAASASPSVRKRFRELAARRR